MIVNLAENENPQIEIRRCDRYITSSTHIGHTQHGTFTNVASIN